MVGERKNVYEFRRSENCNDGINSIHCKPCNRPDLDGVQVMAKIYSTGKMKYKKCGCVQEVHREYTELIKQCEKHKLQLIENVRRFIGE